MPRPSARREPAPGTQQNTGHGGEEKLQRDGGEREGDAYKRADGGERGEHRAAQQHTCIGFTHVFHLRFQLFKTAIIYTMPAVKKQLWYVTKNAMGFI